MKAWHGKRTIAITLYYSIFNGNIKFWLKCFVLVIIPLLVMTSFWWEWRLTELSRIGYQCIVVFLKVASWGHSCLMYLSMIWIFLSTLFSKALYWLICFLPVFIPFLVIIFSNFWWKYFYFILFLYYSTFGFSKFSEIEIFGKTINLLVSWSLKATFGIIDYQQFEQLIFVTRKKIN